MNVSVFDQCNAQLRELQQSYAVNRSRRNVDFVTAACDALCDLRASLEGPEWQGAVAASVYGSSGFVVASAPHGTRKLTGNEKVKAGDQYYNLQFNRFSPVEREDIDMPAWTFFLVVREV